MQAVTDYLEVLGGEHGGAGATPLEHSHVVVRFQSPEARRLEILIIPAGGLWSHKANSPVKLGSTTVKSDL